MPVLTGPECLEPGCYKRTREGKPYCSEHLDRIPYVARIMEEHAARKKEAEEGPKGDSHYIDDIIILLTHSPRTTDGLAKDLRIPKPIVQQIIMIMRRKKIVRLGKTFRHLTIVELL